MDHYRFRERHWRYYRNWLLIMLAWALLIVTMARVSRTAAPWLSLTLMGLPAIFFMSAFYLAYRATHPRINLRQRRLTPQDADLDCEPVEVKNSDGTALFGWFLPGKNDAVIILLHNLGTHGLSLIDYAALLVEHGFNVFMPDLRAHGSSQGAAFTAGWQESNDVTALVDYLQLRPDVSAEKIGVLGVQAGAQIGLRAAAQNGRIRAVIAERPVPATYADTQIRDYVLWKHWYGIAFNWLFYRLLSLLNGVREPAGVAATIQRIAPRPVLIIASGPPAMRAWAHRFFKLANSPKDIWDPERPTTEEGHAARSAEYERRITTFFIDALHPTD